MCRWCGGAREGERRHWRQQPQQGGARQKAQPWGRAGSNCIHLTVRSSSPTYTKGAHAVRGYKTLGTKHIRGYKSLGTNRQARGQAVSHTLKAQLGEEPGVLALLVLFGEHLAAN